MKKIVVICVTVVLALILSACSGNGTAQGTNNPDGGIFTIEDLQYNPAYYVGVITLKGVVGNSITQDFTLQNESGTFEVLVDYRGSQSLPQIGDVVIAEGTLRQNRPCCGPGFTLTSTQFGMVD